MTLWITNFVSRKERRKAYRPLIGISVICKIAKGIFNTVTHKGGQFSFLNHLDSHLYLLLISFLFLSSFFFSFKEKYYWSLKFHTCWKIWQKLLGAIGFTLFKNCYRTFRTIEWRNWTVTLFQNCNNSENKDMTDRLIRFVISLIFFRTETACPRQKATLWIIHYKRQLMIVQSQLHQRTIEHSDKKENFLFLRIWIGLNLWSFPFGSIGGREQRQGRRCRTSRR